MQSTCQRQVGGGHQQLGAASRLRPRHGVEAWGVDAKPHVNPASIRRRKLKPVASDIASVSSNDSCRLWHHSHSNELSTCV
jgi:hypothetical protein